MKNPPANPGDVGLIPGSEDPLGEGMATHTAMDTGARRATVRHD